MGDEHRIYTLEEIMAWSKDEYELFKKTIKCTLSIDSCAFWKILDSAKKNYSLIQRENYDTILVGGSHRVVYRFFERGEYYFLHSAENEEAMQTILCAIR